MELARFLVASAVGCAVWLVSGLAVYMTAYGPAVWSDGWLYVVAVLWPLALAWWFVCWILPYALWTAAGVAAAVFCLWAWATRHGRRTG